MLLMALWQTKNIPCITSVECFNFLKMNLETFPDHTSVMLIYRGWREKALRRTFFCATTVHDYPLLRSLKKMFPGYLANTSSNTCMPDSIFCSCKLEYAAFRPPAQHFSLIVSSLLRPWWRWNMSMFQWSSVFFHSLLLLLESLCVMSGVWVFLFVWGLGFFLLGGE